MRQDIFSFKSLTWTTIKYTAQCKYSVALPHFKKFCKFITEKVNKRLDINRFSLNHANKITIKSNHF